MSKKKNDSKEELQQENNFLKAKLIAEKGAKIEETSPMPAEMENEWLNYIFNFEEVAKKVPKITVFEKIGKPHYKPAHELSEAQVSKELEYLYIQMNKHGIDLSCICDYPDQVIYKFITEELFEYVLNDIKVEGLIHCFTYEDFHPNHKYDIQQIVLNILEALLSREWHKMDGTFLSNFIQTHTKTISEDELINKIQLFQKSFINCAIKKMEINHLHINSEIAEASVEIDLNYELFFIADRKESYEGISKFTLTKEYGFWNVTSISIPGFI